MMVNVKLGRNMRKVFGETIHTESFVQVVLGQ